MGRPDPIAPIHAMWAPGDDRTKRGWRSTRALVRGTWVAGLAALLLGGWLGNRVAAAGVTVLSYTPDRIVLAEAPYVMVRGLLLNGAGVPAQDIRVTLRLRRTPGGEILAGPAFGQSWLGTLSPGESGPFSVAVRYCCPEDVGAYDLDIAWRGATHERYRSLAAEAHDVWESGGLARLYGELINTGDEFTDASTTRVYVGFWSGDDLIDARAAVLPVRYEVGPGGMAHPPGYRLPWSTTLPDRPFDRVQVWAVADRYPPGEYPVPLGVRRLIIHRDAPQLELAGTLYNCGRQPVHAIVVVVIARDARGRVLQFDQAALSLPGGLPPSGSQAMEITWPSARPEVRAAHIEVSAFARDAQTERPAAVPCADPAPGVLLPHLSR